VNRSQWQEWQDVGYVTANQSVIRYYIYIYAHISTVSRVRHPRSTQMFAWDCASRLLNPLSRPSMSPLSLFQTTVVVNTQKRNGSVLIFERRQ